MADLREVDFALMPGPARKQKQFRLPDDFSNIDVTILSRTSHPASGFPAIFHNTKQTAIRRSANFFARRQRSKKFQHFRSQR